MLYFFDRCLTLDLARMIGFLVSMDFSFLGCFFLCVVERSKESSLVTTRHSIAGESIIRWA